MRKLVILSCIALAAVSGAGNLLYSHAFWSWLTLLSAAAGIAALLLPATVGPAALPLPAPAVRPRSDRQQSLAVNDSTKTLREELARYKQLEQELVAAKQAAEAAMMSKGEFLATMSHEIRTPLNGIIPLLDILLGSPLQADQREYVRTAYQSARQLLRIVDDILDYSKLEANKLTLETVGLNLRELFDSVMRLMEKQAEAKSLKLTLAVEPNVRLAVRGDSVRLRQVLTNLLSNAIKFTERGQIVLRVKRVAETRESHLLRFEVEDTGIGLSQSACASLFQPFSQADASTTRTFGGTGLGLVICKRIVDLMGGQIGVQSTVGRGSTFWFEAPILKAIGDMGSLKRDLNGTRCLLLTTDDALSRRLATVMPGWGVTPIHANSTHDALAKLRAAGARSQSWAFDLLIVDLASVRTTAVALQRSLMREPALSSLRVTWLEDDSGNPVALDNEPGMQFVSRNIADSDLRQSLSSSLESDINSGTSTDREDAEALPAPPPSVIERLNGHVLLVEDNPVNRQVAHRLLSLSGLTLDVAENGLEALELMQSRTYAAVLMDCQMPVMDGYTATRKRREAEKSGAIPRLPIVAMTANAMVGDREKCLQAGMDDYLSKPLNRALLEKTLQRWMNGSKASAAVHEQRGAATVQPTRPQLTAVPTAMPDRRVSADKPAAQVPAAAASQVNRVTPSAGAAIPSPGTAMPKPSADKPASSDSRQSPLQDDIIADLREIMGAEFSSLVVAFLEDAPRAIMLMEAAAGMGDRDALVAPAHSLKSTAANLGAITLSDLAKQIEHGARRGLLTRPESIVSALSSEYVRVDRALRQLLN